MIRIENLTKNFDSENGIINVLNGINLTVKKGEIFGIIGLSGAGKSTLVRCINRLEEPTSGKIFIDGEEVTAMDNKSLRELRTEVGMIFQSFNLFDQLNVYDNVVYPLNIIGKEKNEIENTVNNLLDFVGLSDKKKEFPSKLSGGQKQRVAIARALATKPKVLLSDEGTSALDPSTTESILALLRRAVEEYHLTIVMITHQMEVAKEICDKIAVMENGKIIEENTVEELFKNPQTHRTKAFIQGLEIVSIDEDFSDVEGIPIRLTFDSSTAKEPIVSRIIRDYDVDINVISGNINDLREAEIGYLNVEIIADEKKANEVVEGLKDKGIQVEVLR